MEELTRMTKNEFPELAELLNEVFRRPAGYPPLMIEEYPQVFRDPNLENMRIIKVDGKLVSHIAIMPEEVLTSHGRLKVGAIGCVATLPQYRGRGYSTLLLKDVLKKMDGDGMHLSILWTSIYDFYRRVDFEHIGIKKYVLDETTAGTLKVSGDYELVPFEFEKHWEKINRLHEREDLKVVRTQAYYRKILLRSSFFEGKALDVLLAGKGGEIISYYVPWASEEGGEYGGDGEGIKFLIREYLRGEGRKPVKVPVLYDSPLSRELVGRVPSELGGDMLRVINMGRIVEDVEAINRRLNYRETGGVHVLEGGGETLAIPDTGKLTRLVCGLGKAGNIFPGIPPRLREILEEVFPIKYCFWALDHC